jgi:hypothetical protein
MERGAGDARAPPARALTIEHACPRRGSDANGTKIYHVSPNYAVCVLPLEVRLCAERGCGISRGSDSWP